MIVLGVLFILVAVGATVFAVMAPSATNETIVVTALGVKVSASPLAMFIAGAVSVALLGLAYVLISRGTRRKARSRKELRQLRKEQAAAGTGPSTEGGHRSVMPLTLYPAIDLKDGQCVRLRRGDMDQAITIRTLVFRGPASTGKG